MLSAAVHRSKAGRAAYPRKKERRIAPIMGGVKRYYRKNAFGNMQLPPIIVSNRSKYHAPRMGTPRFRKIFRFARPSARFSGSHNFSDLGILDKAVKQILAIEKKLIVKENITNDIKSPFVRGNVFQFMCSKKEFLHLQYIRAFYIFLMHTRKGKYVRSFGPRSFEWEDLNNVYDPWLNGWRFELIDEIWNRIWDHLPKLANEHYMSGIKVPGRIPYKRIWRRNDYVTDESIKQCVRYLIEELIDAAYWNMAFNLVF
jgi:hypothetical protein